MAGNDGWQCTNIQEMETGSNLQNVLPRKRYMVTEVYGDPYSQDGVEKRPQTYKITPHTEGERWKKEY